MSEFVVRVLDARGRTLARFLAVGSYGRALRAGYERADSLPTARDVSVVRI